MQVLAEAYKTGQQTMAAQLRLQDFVKAIATVSPFSGEGSPAALPEFLGKIRSMILIYTVPAEELPTVYAVSTRLTGPASACGWWDSMADKPPPLLCSLTLSESGSCLRTGPCRRPCASWRSPQRPPCQTSRACAPAQCVPPSTTAAVQT